MIDFYINFGLTLLASIVLGVWFSKLPEQRKESISQKLGITYVPLEERTRMNFLRNQVNGRKQFRKEFPMLIVVVVIGMLCLAILEVS